MKFKTEDKNISVELVVSTPPEKEKYNLPYKG